jgi:hypothetical protein
MALTMPCLTYGDSFHRYGFLQIVAACRQVAAHTLSLRAGRRPFSRSWGLSGDAVIEWPRNAPNGSWPRE